MHLNKIIVIKIGSNVLTLEDENPSLDQMKKLVDQIQKLHARGPMALRELCSYKWVVKGEGQIRD